MSSSVSPVGSRGELWLPALIAVLGVLASLGGWGWLVADRRATVRASSQDLLVDTRTAIEEQVAAYLLALESLADLRALDPTHETWRAQAQLLRRSFPAVVSTRWQGSVADPGSAGTPPPGSPRWDAPDDGSLRLRLPAPGGLLEARVDPGLLLDRSLRGKARGYALRVRREGREIFARGEPSPDPWQTWWRATSDVELPHGLTWSVLLRPTPELAARVLTPIPHYLLASGLALSAVLAGLGYQLRVTHRQSRFLAASNQALEERGIELEGWVSDRTRDLEDAVGELQLVNQAISHDLRSPLGAVMNFATILEEDYQERSLDGEGIEVLRRIRRSALRATRLLDGLQRLSQAGRSDLHLEWIDLGELAREISAQVRASVESGEHRAEVQIGELPRVRADRSLIGDVLANLITNAIVHGEQGKGRVEISAHLDDGGCVVEVSDNGPGFDMRFAEKLFEPFERLDTESDADGTGMGLAIVDKIVRRHGGRVWAEIPQEGGARFCFTLPEAGAQS